MKTDTKDSLKIYNSPSFYSDKNDENLLYAVLVRSQAAEGCIQSISHPSLPEGYTLLSAKDIPGENVIRTFDTEFPVFACEKISYKGEPVGILTGKDYGTLQRLLTEIEITYETPANETAQQKKKTVLKDTLAERRYAYGNFEQAWKNAKLKADKTYELKLQLPSNSETDGAFCRIQGKNIVVYTPSRWTKHLRENLCGVLNFDKTRIQLYRTLFSSAITNSPWHNTVLSVQCALAAVCTKKPVLLSLTRREQTLYIDRPLPVKIRHKTAVTAEGSISAASVDISVDAGAFNPFIAPLLDSLAVSSLNAYKPENCIVEARAYRTPNPPGAASMQWADYHGLYAMESHIQELARISDLNSADIRLKNIFPAKKTGKNFPFHLEINPLKDVIADVIQKSDFYRKFASYKLNGFKPENLFSTVPLRGIGFSCGYEGNGFLGTKMNSLRQSLDVSMEKDGSTVIYAKASSSTVSAIWKQTAAELLGIPVKSVIIDNCNTQTEETELPETITGNISVMTQLLKKCCDALQKLRFRQPLPIRVKRSLSTGKKNMWNHEKFCGTPFYTTSWAAAVAEVELDAKTYTYTVRNIWISIDGGTILYDAKAVLAVQQSIRRLFSCSEEFQKSPMPSIFVNFIPSSTEPKQIGELVFNVLPAAIGNAVCQALRQKITEFPVNPEAVYECIKKSEQEYTDAHTADDK